ncbi:site-specific tyrosine recombinase [Sphingobium phage Lacusarx]|uniref:Integrase n=1 Tax=Sphingobium phage Lacusarx TaxID=1980139 RepID=A0A1W6DX53_9CAUD|nr:site-specific tyrosine recombinase [Sphingobium phage Lacusarx]ARK07503.1 site-specific tyrosine recombinase [Sphingobium phage Lacusarx]
MAREDSPFIVGDFWLDKRRDGKSPTIWQIASYDDSRSIRFRSTRCSDVDDAKQVILAHVEEIRSKQPQSDDSKVAVVAQIILYWDEHGSKAISSNSIATYLRNFIAFLREDEVTMACSFAELKPAVFRRFVAWMRAPHSYSLTWKGKTYNISSKGCNDATIKKNLRMVSAALHHAVAEERAQNVPMIPKTIMDKLETPGRDRVLTLKELGSIVGYARSDPPLLRFVLLMLATAARPEAAMLMCPSDQFTMQYGLIDLHPKGRPLTKKRNPIIPCIPQFADLLAGHEGLWVREDDGTSITSMRKRWLTMREVLGLSDDVVAKTIRHTVATEMEWREADEMQVSRLLGHVAQNRTSGTYRHYNPKRMASVRSALIELWDDVQAAADQWNHRYVVARGPNGKLVRVERKELSVPYDPTKRLTLSESLTENQTDEAKQRRRDQINTARRLRKARVAGSEQKK